MLAGSMETDGIRWILHIDFLTAPSMEQKQFVPSLNVLMQKRANKYVIAVNQQVHTYIRTYLQVHN